MRTSVFNKSAKISFFNFNSITMPRNANAIQQSILSSFYLSLEKYSFLSNDAYLYLKETIIRILTINKMIMYVQKYKK